MVLAPFNSYLGPSLSGARDCGRRLALRRNFLSADLDKEDDSSVWQEALSSLSNPQPKSAISLEVLWDVFGGQIPAVVMWMPSTSRIA